jgi:hypothetical protein
MRCAVGGRGDSSRSGVEWWCKLLLHDTLAFYLASFISKGEMLKKRITRL